MHLIELQPSSFEKYSSTKYYINYESTYSLGVSAGESQHSEYEGNVEELHAECVLTENIRSQTDVSGFLFKSFYTYSPFYPPV
jgi:hypothetical protein